MNAATPQPAPFRVEVHASGEGPVAILVAGELDRANVSKLSEALQGAQRESRPVAVDLTLCEFIDSSGLAELLLAHRRSRDDKLEFRVYGANDQVSRMLATCGLSQSRFLVDGSTASVP